MYSSQHRDKSSINSVSCLMSDTFSTSRIFKHFNSWLQSWLCNSKGLYTPPHLNAGQRSCCWEAHSQMWRSFAICFYHLIEFSVEILWSSVYLRANKLWLLLLFCALLTSLLLQITLTDFSLLKLNFSNVSKVIYWMTINHTFPQTLGMWLLHSLTDKKVALDWWFQNWKLQIFASLRAS